MADVWSQLAAFAMRIDRFDLRRSTPTSTTSTLKPIRAAAVISVPPRRCSTSASTPRRASTRELRRDADRATRQTEREAQPATPSTAHELLARIALAQTRRRRRARGGRLAQEARSEAMPLAAYIDARLLYDQGKYDDALPSSSRPSPSCRKPAARRSSPELHYYAADTLGASRALPRCRRRSSTTELRLFPQNMRARGGLAMLYQATERPDEAERARSATCCAITPTPEYLRARRAAVDDVRQSTASRCRPRGSATHVRRRPAGAARAHALNATSMTQGARGSSRASETCSRGAAERGGLPALSCSSPRSSSRSLPRQGRQADLQADSRPERPARSRSTRCAPTRSACYGGRAATPALDRLAAAGVRFDFAHAHAVMTLPSHASILTGQYPFQHGMRDNSGYRLPPDARTAATLLKRAGLRHRRVRRRVSGALALRVERRVRRLRRPVRRNARPDRVRHAGTAGDRGRAARARLDRGRGRRSRRPHWFAWVHVFDPHAPYRPPPPFDSQYATRPV